jgi:tetratricopeptide (TPR) repeat protein
MQESSNGLAKKAIQASLKGNWDLAIELNNKILEKNPNSLDAKIRLGRAYLVKKDFDKAKKLFEEVLKKDPINKIAKKNLQIAKQKRIENPATPQNTKSLLKTPGTTEQTTFKISNKSIKCESFAPGEEFDLKIRKNTVGVYRKDGKLIGNIDKKDLVSRIYAGKAKKTEFKTAFVKCKGNECTIIIKANMPVFKADKIDIRPYLKKGSIEEPKLEIDGEEIKE